MEIPFFHVTQIFGLIRLWFGLYTYRGYHTNSPPTQRSLVFFFPDGKLQVPTHRLFTKILVFFSRTGKKKELSILVLILKAQVLKAFTFFQEYNT